MTQVSVITSAHSVADARLHRLTSALIRANISVEVIALGDEKNAPAGCIFRPALGSQFHASVGGHGFFGRILRDLVIPFKTKSKVIIVLAPDLLPMAKLVSKLRGQRIVADVYEDYVRLLRDRSWATGLTGTIANYIAKSATKIAAKCDLTTVADTQVPPFHAKDRLVVRNLPDLNVLTQSGELSPKPRAIYIGDLRTSRGLKTMLDVAQLSPGWHFDFVGQVAQADKALVAAFLLTPAAERTTFYGRLSPANSWKLAAGAWVGLSLLEATPAFVEAVPSKLYEYLAVGLATITTPLPRCVALIEQSQAGAIATDPIAIADLLTQWESDPKPLIQMRERGRIWAGQNLDSEAEYRAFASRVESLIKRSR
jgi:glycosyltransferase involved in cell wall biosynthesis